VHSSYRRRIADGPIAGSRVLIHGMDPVMPLTYRPVQAFCGMIRERRGYECDVWIVEVHRVLWQRNLG
jgi:hypothetical protein